MKNERAIEPSFGPKNPVPLSIPLRDQPEAISVWQERYERYLFSIGRKATRDRYARALEKFLGKYPGRTFAHDFLRPLIHDYVQSRLAEGAAVSTVRLELSAIRGLFQFMIDMNALGVFLNPARGVRVPKPLKRSTKSDSQP